MYKVEEVAKELNISRQAVYKKLNKESIQKYIILEDGIKHLTENGLRKLKGIKIEEKEAEYISDDDIEMEVATTSLHSVDNKLIEVLTGVISSKERDVDHLRGENERLVSLLEQQNQLLLNSQKLQDKALSNTEILLLEKRQQLIERKEKVDEKSKFGFMGRLKYLFSGK